MRKLNLTALFCMMLASCGTTTPSALNGTWAANLQASNGSDVFGFTSNLMQTKGTSVAVSNFALGFPNGSPNSCLSGQTSENATFSSTGNSNGVQTGQFAMTITDAQGNVLTIQGNLMSNSTNESITGGWTLTGSSGCNTNGTFSMNPLPKV